MARKIDQTCSMAFTAEVKDGQVGQAVKAALDAMIKAFSAHGREPVLVELRGWAGLEDSNGK